MTQFINATLTKLHRSTNYINEGYDLFILFYNLFIFSMNILTIVVTKKCNTRFDIRCSYSFMKIYRIFLIDNFISI